MRFKSIIATGRLFGYLPQIERLLTPRQTTALQESRLIYELYYNIK